MTRVFGLIAGEGEEINTRMNHRLRAHAIGILYWIPAILWIVLIVLSGSPYGAFLGKKVRQLTHTSWIVKGIFHIGEFAILTILVFVALNIKKKKLNLEKALLYAVITSFGVAFFSEFEQFVFSSFCLFEWNDLFMNVVGIGLITLLFYLTGVRGFSYESLSSGGRRRDKTKASHQ